MVSPGRPSTVRRAFWVRIRVGDSLYEAADACGVSHGAALAWYRENGGVMPRDSSPGAVRPRLTFEQREEIAILKAQGCSDAEIARVIGCHRSTVGREVKANSKTFTDGHRPQYKASTAQKRSEWKARRPKESKLALSDRLCQEVSKQLKAEHSPEQIAHRLHVDFPNDPEMRVSHETIYKALFVQGRGALRRDLHTRLRTGRAIRKTRRAQGERRGKIPGMVSIVERPPEVEDRAVPGHWESQWCCQAAIGSVRGGSAVNVRLSRIRAHSTSTRRRANAMTA